jgi:PhnB protein
MESIPKEHQVAMPYLTLKDPEAFLEFLKKVFDAKENLKVMNQEGTGILHAEALVLGYCIMVGSAEKSPEQPSGLSIVTPHVDEIYNKALEAGASSIMAPCNPGWGKIGGFRDQFGSIWWIVEAKNIDPNNQEKKTLAFEQGEGLWSNFSLKNAPGFLEFLKKVFNAEERDRKVMEDGKTIMHAEAAISGSIIMCSEGSEQKGYYNGGVFVYVSNTDETHKLALAEGATEISAPSDQSYGRFSGFKDPFGNIFWINTIQKK